MNTILRKFKGDKVKNKPFSDTVEFININKLPVEILSIILGFINSSKDKNSCIAVCKFWKALCLRSWRHKKIKQFKYEWWTYLDPLGYSSVAYARWIESIHQDGTLP